MITNDIICAISTPQGNGAIAVIRLSGIGSIELCDKFFQSPKNDKRLIDQSANTIHFGGLKDNDQLIDEVLVSIFRNPHSYTGEDSIEISCHGSEYIQQQVLQLFIKAGARLARPGEFTMRAFLNGKMDLSQAEAVADLIASASAASHKVAIQQMRGGFSNEIAVLRGQLLHFISLLELELDFSEEEVEFADRKQLNHLLLNIQQVIAKLINSFKLGNVIKNGIPVAIVGQTNVGKSTLLNRILNEEKAIVSEIAGTTRDVIEDVINIEGVAFRFIDTAGIRETTDTIETIGIERTFDRIDKASVVLLLIDASDNEHEISSAIKKVKDRIGKADKKLIALVNKMDQLDKAKETIIDNILSKNLSTEDTRLKISAQTGKNMEQLVFELLSAVNLNALNQNEVIITNIRHYEALQRASESLQRAIEGLNTGLTGDFLAQDIRETLHYLGEISGEITTNEVLSNIFKNFCIGK
ncbi:MAG: tRNA uridine-5-carboxymethylaminomethyl(34) synthesis GTPase MnmE [Bacteroidetes bacterium GWC2_33_15]|nr:MAG: tRNA uridine-5-carboxymethylaminomethyl(34) synthesis GTPase MnmE [Bacteroidetes bacterium GWA2_33_15]OFX51568.1 MAG: tRNA uridine-5-carboxymethylaminomethyl(34) synthesis GTPase MnmE [Bacteroidetes bacterium GWC2_33_15]OFX63363.1 MAG: tRNA uridine-5-carboxymethylaminomethyl(34) synthesis GTPase MnmE [Bacteroidetes bacterium GWB2_32_14]OFX68038.1 MAG: tRNA uridine-5-carboxymethylaminomethyl(34) synthesis GTPase MnmE [Bacteroidetes bacterium GWD2_33_33]HAN17142.1 tRNA uridine-5-carboxyme